MTHRSRFARWGSAVLGLAATVGAASASTLYDPGLGSAPSAQGWTFGAAGPFAAGVAAGAYGLDTTETFATSAGSVYLAGPRLDTGGGFTLDFALRIDAEAHRADNQRAGYSVIVVGADPGQSLELGFWQDRVFAYTAGFVPGASASFATAAATDYSLAVAGGQYRLYADGSLLLAGSLVDYRGRGIAPYTTPGAIFFGDDTTRAQSSSRLGAVSLAVAAVPEPATAASVALGLVTLALLRRRRSS